MSKVSAVLESTPAVKAPREHSALKDVLDRARHTLEFVEILITTTLPRGSLQIVQPYKVPEDLLKGYSREFHTEDRLTWQAITKQAPVASADCWNDRDYETSRYLQEFLQPAGLYHGAAAPLDGPVLDGYSGAVHVYRSSQQGPFTAAELEQLATVARELDRVVAETRQARRAASSCPNEPYRRLPARRQFIFDASLNQRLPGSDLDALDPTLRQHMLETARARFEHVNGEAVVGDRVQLADTDGDLWNFRVVTHRAYPALGDGPFTFFCIQPACADWGAVRAVDVQADEEMARLIPALRFMQQEFHRQPTLKEIARTVHLSPFHFHRRFTELLGLTPKHFLLDCQIAEAKRQLVERKKDLAQIASDCGFAHQSHFTSRFKQATGLTPTRWRRLASGGNAQ